MGQPVMHWQLLARNPDRAAEFYEALFGWSIEARNALGYRVVNTRAPGGVDGGIWPAPPEGQAMVTLYVEVENVGQQIKRATELGATVVLPPQVLPDGDEMAVILDPEGIPFGLMHRAALRHAKGRTQ